MPLAETRLFLGFAVDSLYSRYLSELDPRLLDLYINDKEQYLTRMTLHGQLFLGKFSSSPTQVSRLELLESNILSLLKKLVPNYSYETTPLRLLAVV